MHDFRQLLTQAGFRLRPPATVRSLANLVAELCLPIPDGLRGLWLTSDGASRADMELLSVAGAQEYGDAMSGAGLIPFTDCNDSNPYVVSGRGPLMNYIVHVQHDGDTNLICSDLERFLELVSDAGEEVDQLVSDYAMDSPDRTPEHAEIARALLREAQATQMDDWNRGNALRFAIQLFGAGDEAALAEVMAAGNEYTRDAVRERWVGMDTDAARRLLAADDATYRRFLDDLRRAFESAGVRTESDRDEFVLLVGRVGLDFRMLYADRLRQGAMSECVERFRKQLN